MKCTYIKMMFIHAKGCNNNLLQPNLYRNYKVKTTGILFFFNSTSNLSIKPKEKLYHLITHKTSNTNLSIHWDNITLKTNDFKHQCFPVACIEKSIQRKLFCVYNITQSINIRIYSYDNDFLKITTKNHVMVLQVHWI